MSYITDKDFCDFALSELNDYYDLDRMKEAISAFEDIAYSKSFIVDHKYGINLMDRICEVVEMIMDFDIDEVIQFKNVEFPDEVYSRAGIQKGAPLYCTFNCLCNGSYEEGIKTEEGVLDNNDVAFCLFKTPDQGLDRGEEEIHWFNNPSVVVPIYSEEEELAKEIALAIAKYFYHYMDKNFDYEKISDEWQREYKANQDEIRSIYRSFM